MKQPEAEIITTEDKTGQVFPGQPGGLLPCPTGWKALLWTEFFRVWLSCAQTQPEGWDALCSLQHHYLGNHTSRPCPSLSGRLKCLLFHSFQFCFFSKLHNPLSSSASRDLRTVPKRASVEANLLFMPPKTTYLRWAQLHTVLPAPALLSETPNPISHTFTAKHHNSFCMPWSSSYQPAAPGSVEQDQGGSTALATSGDHLAGPLWTPLSPTTYCVNLNRLVHKLAQHHFICWKEGESSSAKALIFCSWVL